MTVKQYILTLEPLTIEGRYILRRHGFHWLIDVDNSANDRIQLISTKDNHIITLNRNHCAITRVTEDIPQKPA